MSDQTISGNLPRIRALPTIRPEQLSEPAIVQTTGIEVRARTTSDAAVRCRRGTSEARTACLNGLLLAAGITVPDGVDVWLNLNISNLVELSGRIIGGEAIVTVVAEASERDYVAQQPPAEQERVA